VRRRWSATPPRARRALASIAVAGAVLGAVACSGVASTTAASPVELTVYGAASLSGALEEIATAYALHVPGVTLIVSTGASSALRTQIEQGAPADVFLSADTQQPTALVNAGSAAGDSRIFASNELTVITSLDAEKVIAPVDLADPGVKIIAAGDAVPITRYANQVVANLARLDGYPAGFAEAYAANIVSREDDVKAVVAKIELGEADAAIVYRTDALAADAVAVVRIPDVANVAASYAGVAIKASTHPSQAAAFLDWLTASEGQALLASHGFSPAAP
jgi:molybdate transport system substrate-binding protein